MYKLYRKIVRHIRRRLAGKPKSYIIPGSPLVSIVIPAFKRPKELRAVLASLLAQTYPHLEIIVIHDGIEGSDEAKKVCEMFQDDRIKFSVEPNRKNDYGHSLRESGSLCAKGAYIGHSNDDNLYAPVYVQRLVATMIEKNADFAYCNMVHDHEDYRAVSTHAMQFEIDAGGWIAKAELVKATKWRDRGFDGDGVFIEDMLATGAKAVKVPGYLFVHN